MGAKSRTVGGGAATGLGNDFVNFLQQGLNTGTFGPGFAAGGNAMGSTQGIAGFLNDVLSGGAGVLGGSLQKMLQTQQTNDVNSLRARFGSGGGTAFGTPAAYAESSYRSQAAPQIATAIGGLQSNILSQLLPQYGALAARGIPQAENVMQPSPFMQFASVAAPLAGGILGGPLGASIGGALFGGGGGAANMMPSSGFSLPGGSGGFNPNIDFNSFFRQGLGGMSSGGYGSFMPQMQPYSPFAFNPSF